MSEFCENCPMRGNINSQIETVITAPIDYVTRKALGYGPIIDSYKGIVGAILDVNKNASDPMKIPSESSSEKPLLERLSLRLDSCDKPHAEARGIIKKREFVVGCPALGRLAIDPFTRQHIKQIFARELI